MTLHQNDQVMIFNSSYGNGCNAGYTSLTEQVDNEIYNNPSLIQVFSAGNSGGSDCGYGAGTSFGNVTGGHKIGKNVIATANLDESDALENSSSRGPSEDGRLKPDISAHGAGQMSTDPNNTYAAGGGTSAAAPGIAGTCALLYHAYKDLNGGVNPNSGLIKACILNSAEDLGNVGPDYSFGWGRINGHRAVSILEDNQYLLDSVTNGAVNTHTITVPAGVEEMRVMLYWMDPAGSPSSSIILVNDLDLTVDDPSVTTFQPLVLDPTPNVTNLSATAVPGRDSLNNMEQVRINSAVAGTYTVRVDGFSIPFGNQKYYVVWEFIKDEITVTYPFGAEGFVPGEQEIIRWDAYGNSGTFSVEYSLDNGATWNFISSSVAGAIRERVWTVPSTSTERALIRVSRGAVTDQSDANFVISETPANITLDWVCVDSLQLSWDQVPGAAIYEVSMLGSMYMDSITRTSADSVILYGHDYNVEDWFSVKAVLPTGGEGRRAIAIQKAPGIVGCPLAYSVEVSEIVSPIEGTMYNCHSGPTVPVMIQVTNVGMNPIFNIPVVFTVNGGTPNMETILDTLQPGEDTLYTFVATANLSTNGLYQIVTWSEHPLDQFVGDDTLNVSTTVATSLTLSGVWMQDFEGFSSCGTSNDCGVTICNAGAGWKNESSSTVDDNDWRTDNDGTPSAGTGPNTDHTLGTSSGNYMFTEASGGCTEMEALLLTPCIDLSGMGAPFLSFWYHMDGSDMGELAIDVFNGVTYDTDLWTISGDQGGAWIEATVDLSAYAGQIINVRFRGTTGDNFRSDMAIDDIGITTPFSIEEMDQTQLNIWPVPASNLLTIDYANFTDGPYELKIMDILGKVVKTQVISNSEGQINVNVEGFTQGSYVLTIRNADAVGMVRKIVIVH
ncbi:MAG: S8 family serine peptidase [Flavobacteriales bacterium]|nr:S8 family serine peptidase [Flavobacteriales bacterium]